MAINRVLIKSICNIGSCSTQSYAPNDRAILGMDNFASIIVVRGLLNFIGHILCSIWRRICLLKCVTLYPKKIGVEMRRILRHELLNEKTRHNRPNSAAVDFSELLTGNAFRSIGHWTNARGCAQRSEHLREITKHVGGVEHRWWSLMMRIVMHCLHWMFINFSVTDIFHRRVAVPRPNGLNPRKHSDKKCPSLFEFQTGSNSGLECHSCFFLW